MKTIKNIKQTHQTTFYFCFFLGAYFIHYDCKEDYEMINTTVKQRWMLVAQKV